MTENNTFYFIQKTFSLLEVIAKFGIAAWAIVEVVPHLAGEDTFISVLYSDGSTSCKVSWVFVGILFVWGFLERNLRRSKTKELTLRNQNLERRLDPERSSSGLTPVGQTDKEDMVL